MRRALVAGVVLVLGATSSLVATAQPEARTVTVTPDTALIDGQTVTVTGTGWGPADALALYQCRSPVTGFDCRRMTVAQDGIEVADDGTFTGSARVRAVYSGESSTIDCRVQACALAVDYIFRIDGAPERGPLDPPPPSEGSAFPLASVPIGFDPAGPLLPPPTMTVTPDSGLVDGEQVSVTGTGFTPDSEVHLEQCPAGSTARYRCDRSGPLPVVVTSDGTGAISATMPVFVRIHGFDVRGVDCRIRSCAVVAYEVELPGDPRGEAPITFDPSAPLSPRPSLTVSPATDLVDGQQVHIHGTGFRPHAAMYIDQCRDDGTPDPWDCRYTDGFGEADAAGVVDADFTVRESFTGEGQVHCSRQPCVITVLDFQGDPLFKLPITFRAPAGPSLAQSCDLVHFNPPGLFIGAVTAGPDGNVWFEAGADDERARIGYITHDGAITTFRVGSNVFGIADLVAGPDGNVWFTAEGFVWRSTPSGEIAKVANPGSAGPIIVGPDGALWFGMVDGIGRVTTGGTLTEFTAPAVGNRPDELTIGPDGDVWYVAGSELRKITASGSVGRVATDLTDYGVDGLDLGTGGDIWTSLPYDNRIGRITPSGQVTRFGEPHQLREPRGMVTGSDGELWFVLARGHEIGQVGLDGTVQTFVDAGGRLQEPRWLTLGPDGHLWLSAQGSGLARVDRCGLVGPITATPGFTG